MATRAVKARGRALVALALAGFLVVASLVIWRRSWGIARSRELRDLERHRQELDGRRALLEAEIRDASSRARLAPIAEQRLNMRVPSDSQYIILPRPPKRASPSR